ncbi:MAG: hypothetical protein U1A77_08855 [Pirellulales bacterium]
MQRRTRLVIVLGLGLGLLLAAWLLLSKSGQRVQFLTGGMLVNLGYRMQDHLETYDFQHEGRIEPAGVWREMQSQNELAAKVREWFPRTPHHPLVPKQAHACRDFRRRGARTQRADPQPSEPKSVA